MPGENPIIEEIRRARESILAEHGGDLALLVKEMQRRTEEPARAGRKVIPLPPKVQNLSALEPGKNVG